MAGVGEYDPERLNENPWVDDTLDNDDDDDTTTTSLPPEAYKEPVTDASLRARLNALRDGNIETLTPATAEQLINDTKGFLKARFPEIDFGALGEIRFGTDNYRNRLVVEGPQGGETPIFKVDNKGFMQAFLTTKRTVLALSEKAEAMIARQNAEIRAFRQQQRATAARVENNEMEDLGMKRKKDELRTLEDKLAKGEARVEQMENDDAEDSTTPLLERQQQLERQKKLNNNYRQSRDELQAEIAQQSKTRAQKVAQEKGKETELQTQISASENTRDTLEARLNATKSLDDFRARDAELERKTMKINKSLMTRTPLQARRRPQESGLKNGMKRGHD